MKVETGVMIMKDGKAWGTIHSDGYYTYSGWIAPEDAPIHDPQVLKRPEDAARKGSLDVVELRTGKIVKVQRRTEVIVVDY